MTKSTITRERLEKIAAGRVDARRCNDDEIAMAITLLAAMDSEPVGEFYEDGPLNWYQISDGDRVPAHRRIPLYRHAQPAQVVQMVPEGPPEHLLPKGNSRDTTYRRGAIILAWKLCRSAMLAAAPQSTGSEPAAVPGKWIPVSERLPEEGGRYWCYVEEQNSLGKSHYQWNCSWNGDVWSDNALTGRVTHWMPLPTAPQEVKSES
nr:DUF551 domain-containing protein [Klebsiella michiganensis]